MNETVNETVVETEAVATEAAQADVHMERELTDYEKLKLKKKKWAKIWDKVTTGILILLMASPIAILAYIFLWFIFRT